MGTPRGKYNQLTYVTTIRYGQYSVFEDARTGLYVLKDNTTGKKVKDRDGRQIMFGYIDRIEAWLDYREEEKAIIAELEKIEMEDLGDED